jgi:hypothetical protein
MKPKRGGKNAHKELKQQVRERCWRLPVQSILLKFFADIRSPPVCFAQRKSAWEAASAGAVRKEKAAPASETKDGANRGARSVGGSFAAGGSSLPALDELHPSWAARVKQQDAIKVSASLLAAVSEAHAPRKFPPTPPPI